ncbi:glutathione S-transferase [Fusarium albosuccineum]|uniref:Glutathione S-transferase n=1 Tax=Fusarium albosuccineum TaxID=1237068 RepID=A0A8H4P1D0_9HYPO|nr:glutathione S-transferase [Fusarium albosuccineum]
MADAPDSPRPASAIAGDEAEARRAAPRQRPEAFQQMKNKHQDSALALFNQVVSPAASPATSTETAGVAVLGELEIAARLREMTERGIAPDEQYRVFQNEIWPSINELRGQISKPIYMAATQLLRKQRDMMIQKGLFSGSVDLAQSYSDLGKYDLSIRNELILNICIRATQQRNPSNVRTQLMDELAKMWMHVSQLQRPGEINQPLQFAFPSVPEIIKDAGNARVGGQNKSEAFNGSSTVRALASLFLQFPPPQALDILPGLLATLSVISDTRVAGPAHRGEIAPLLLRVQALLSKYGLTESDIRFVFSHPSSKLPAAKFGKLRAYVVRQWPIVTAMLTTKANLWLKYLDQSVESVTLMANLSTLHKQLKLAHRMQNTGAINAIWDNMVSNLEQSPGLKEQLANDPEFLNYWLFVWCAASRPSRLQQTFDLMSLLGIEPTIKTYTGMMHGWRKCKDLAKIETLWHQLVQSGIKLDLPIWTERISALIDLGHLREGIQALVELVNTWKSAVKKGNGAQAVEPSIEVVNAAFKGALRLDPKAAHDLLAWAGREGFEPNVRTFNILVRETLQSGNFDDVQDLLRAMKKQGIEPDSATFVIILEQVIGQMDEASAEEQVAAVETVFAEIEAAGLQPNLETYGKMLYAVDGISNSADDAIAAVQHHMHSKGFALTPHMVTILIERALRRNPPDINKVRSVLKDNKLWKVSQGDQTLWERVMSAHAVAGETKEAMGIFEQLAEDRRPVTSLPCLTDLMQALLGQEDFESARRVVGVVLEHKLKGEDTKVVNARYWRHHFWFLAKQNGLMQGHSFD